LFGAAAERALTANLTDVLISIRRRRGGAEGKSNKASIDEVGFIRRQLAGTLANQHSVLVIHVFSFRHLGSVEAGPSFSKTCRATR